MKRYTFRTERAFLRWSPGELWRESYDLGLEDGREEMVAECERLADRLQELFGDLEREQKGEQWLH